MKPYLLATDFDGTLAATMVDSPNGMNVLKACDKTMRDIFGREGQRVYREKLHGLQNREPGELMTLMLAEMKMDIPVSGAIELFVAQKLGHLIPEISREWPKLYPGVKELFCASNKGELPLEIAVVSSGHDEFIKRVFEVNGLPAPDIMVTSDILRARKQPDRERYKPNPYQFAEAHRQWRIKHRNGGDILENTIRYDVRDDLKSKIAYMGDDPVKDGGLAEQARVPYLHVPFTNPEFKPDGTRGQILVENVPALVKTMQEGFAYNREGASFSEVFFRKNDGELFPRANSTDMPYAKMLESYSRRERA